MDWQTGKHDHRRQKKKKDTQLTFGHLFWVTFSPHAEIVRKGISYGCIGVVITDIIPIIRHDASQNESQRNQNHTQDQK